MGLHGARTVQYRRDPPQLRHLRVGLRALSVPDRTAAVPWQHARTGRRRPHGHPAAEAVPTRRHPAFDGPRDRHRSGQETRRPLSHGRRNGHGGKGSRHLTQQPAPRARSSHPAGSGEPGHAGADLLVPAHAAGPVRDLAVGADAFQRAESAAAAGAARRRSRRATPRPPGRRVGVHRDADRRGRGGRLRRGHSARQFDDDRTDDCGRRCGRIHRHVPGGLWTGDRSLRTSRCRVRRRRRAIGRFARIVARAVVWRRRPTSARAARRWCRT